jgi:hypothetical protein
MKRAPIPIKEGTMRAVTKTFCEILGIAVIVLLAWPIRAAAQRLKPIPPLGTARAQAQTPPNVASAAPPWTPLTNQPTFLVNGASSPLLLTDGTVMVQDFGSPDWWRLTPDADGSYVNGTWSLVPSVLPAGYSPLYHSSAVLPDGRVIIEGGEYNFFQPVWTNLGAIYNPLSNMWTPVMPPLGWTTIGDAQNVVLANGHYMQANCCTKQAALLNANTLTWTATGTGKFDINDEEGWTLLPSCHDAEGDGTVEGTKGAASFSFRHKECEGREDSDSVSDPLAGHNFQSTQETSATFDGATVTIVGLGTDNGLPVAFALVAADSTLLPPGKFSITLSDGYTLSGSPMSGSITVPDSTGGQVLTVDAYVFPYNSTGTNSEIYNPLSGAWHSAGSTVVQLWDSAANCGGQSQASFEVGPAVLRPDGTVFYTGANRCGSGHTAIFSMTSSGPPRWTAGPDFPNGLDIADGPAALLPNGNVLVDTSPGLFNAPTYFFEFDGNNLQPVPGPPNAPSDSSYFGNMLVLPTGQIFFTDFSNDIEIYTPAGTYNPAWAPQIHTAPATVAPGGSYVISGYHFNGFSQGSAYGDDVQAATNYPLVRITNRTTGHVFYSRTHDPSSMAVAFGGIVSTHFDVPANQEAGASELFVVANGIPSAPVLVNVQ